MLMELYNYITSEAGSKFIINWWKKSGIYDEIEHGSPAFPYIDSFKDIGLLVDENVNDVDVMSNDCTNLVEIFVNDYFDDNESECLEWEDDNEVNFERNAFTRL